ncbi:MAG: heavy-metal-associated domain-containing protein [Desulfobacterales bacterium]
MEKKSFSIPNISCKHCIMTIKNELSMIDGISKIEGDPEKKEITVEWKTPATLEKIKSILKR